MNHNIIIMNTTRDLVTHHFYIIHRTYCVLALNHTLLYMILLREEMLNMHCRTELRKQVDPRFLYTTDILLVGCVTTRAFEFLRESLHQRGCYAHARDAVLRKIKGQMQHSCI